MIFTINLHDSLHTAATLSKIFGGLSSPIRSRGGPSLAENDGVSLISKKALPTDFAPTETVASVHNPHSSGEEELCIVSVFLNLYSTAHSSAITFKITYASSSIINLLGVASVSEGSVIFRPK